MFSLLVPCKNFLSVLKNKRLFHKINSSQALVFYKKLRINRLFANCKGGNLYFISGRGSAISSAKQGKSGTVYNFVINK